MLRLGILASTKGTDMQAIIDAISSKKLDATISVVISNKKDAYALERARKHNIKAVFIDSKNKEREQYDKEIANVLDENKVELILLIGYMRFLSSWFVNKYKNKIMNIHPSLLPKYAGGIDKDVHAEVLKNREKVTGATLHFVDEGTDTGPIIFQKEVKIDENETVDSLKGKVQKAEQEIILKAIDLYSKGKLKVEEKSDKQLVTIQRQLFDPTPLIWWKDTKLLTGIILVILSFAFGFYGKVLFIAKVYEPVHSITGLSIYFFSWILLFIGVGLVGWETIKLAQLKIRFHTKKTVRKTYHRATKFPRKGIHKIKKIAKHIMDKING